MHQNEVQLTNVHCAVPQSLDSIIKNLKISHRVWSQEGSSSFHFIWLLRSPLSKKILKKIKESFKVKINGKVGAKFLWKDSSTNSSFGHLKFSSLWEKRCWCDLSITNFGGNCTVLIFVIKHHKSLTLCRILFPTHQVKPSKLQLPAACWLLAVYNLLSSLRES